MGDLFRRVRANKGHRQAVVIVGHKLAKQFYFIVKNKTPFNEELLDFISLYVLEKREKKQSKALIKTRKEINERKKKMGVA